MESLELWWLPQAWLSDPWGPKIPRHPARAQGREANRNCNCNADGVRGLETSLCHSVLQLQLQLR